MPLTTCPLIEERRSTKLITGKTVTLLHYIKPNYDPPVAVPTDDSYVTDGAVQKCQYKIRKFEGLTRRLASLAEPAKGREILFEKVKCAFHGSKDLEAYTSLADRVKQLSCECQAALRAVRFPQSLF